MNLRVGDWTFPNSWRLPEVKAAATLHSHSRGTGVALAAVLVLGLSALELRSSWLESQVLSAIARRATFVVKPGPSRAQARPGRGPYDKRLGFSELTEFMRRLEARGYRIDTQAWNSPVSLALRHLGFFPIYHEKNQTGLVILDRDGEALYCASYPRQVYSNFESIPPLIVDTLLFIENREMLDSSHPFRNPAIQWGRLSHAAVDLAIHSLLNLISARQNTFIASLDNTAQLRR